jgi:hypothetical protein
MKRQQIWATAAASAISVAAGVGVVLPAASHADAGRTTTSTNPYESPAYLASSSPKTIVLDPSTGAVVSVSPGEPSSVTDASPDISGGTDCASGDGCYYAETVNATYHNRSFYGSAGTFTGNWPQRDAWDSGNYTASVCWESSCSGTYGPNSYVSFGGTLVTGTSFTIY